MKNRKKIITVLISAAAAVLLLLGLVLSAHRRQASAQEDALSLSEVSPQTFVCPEGGGSQNRAHYTKSGTDMQVFAAVLAKMRPPLPEFPPNPARRKKIEICS